MQSSPLLNIDEMYFKEITAHIRPYFTNTILKRGWEYFLDGAVTNIRTEQEGVLGATVQGTKSYQVWIDLHSFTDSICNCPYDGYCKHMAAVVFKVLDMAGLPAKDFLSPATGKKGKDRKINSDGVAKELDDAFSQAAVSSVKKARVTVPKETGSVEDWHRYFHKHFGKPKFFHSYSVEFFYEDVRKQLHPLCQNWDPVIQNIYRIHVWLFVMKQIDNLYRLPNTYYYHYNNHTFLRNKWVHWLDELVQNTRGIDSQRLIEEYGEYLLATIDFLARNAFPEKPEITDWSFVYRYLWSGLLNYKPWVDAERQRLNTELAGSQESAARRDAMVLALVHFDILEGQDLQAMERAEQQLSSKNPEPFWWYLQSFSYFQQWKRLVEWLEWMKPMVKGSGQEAISLYLNYWREAYQPLQRENEWVETLIDFLPVSYSDYADYLMERKQYRQWVDLNLSCDVSLSYVDDYHLKEVESSALPFVLPIYHRAVEQYILQKNRDSYKQAVRILKKLRQFYRRLKEQPRWDRYISGLRAKYARYRAFQEELRKGKLIS